MKRRRAKGSGAIFRPKGSRFWWIGYVSGGKRRVESTASTRMEDAKSALRLRLGDIEKGVPVTPKLGRLSWEEAVEALIDDFTTRGKRSLKVVRRRIAKHLTPFFGGRRLMNIATADIRRYIAQRQAATTMVRSAYDIVREDGTVYRIPELKRTIDGVSNAEINRELQILKRMFNLAIGDGKLFAKPHVPMLTESNVRKGFFEREQFESVRKHLPEAIRPIVTFANITGWRVPSEVLPLTWAQVDFQEGTVRLEPHTTKNDEARTFPMTAELRQLLKQQRTAADAAQRETDSIIGFVFFRLVAKGRRGPKQPKRIRAFTKAWKNACVAAGCPGRIPHDFRRTAVRNLVRAGIPERVAMTMTGHKTRSVFERYNIVSESDLRDAARRLDAFAVR